MGHLMKRQVLMGAVVAATVMLGGCGAKDAEKAPEVKEEALVLDTIEKKVSYIVGFNMATQIKSDGFALDVEAISKGISDVNAGVESAISEEDMRATMMAFQAQMQEKHQASMDKIAEENRLKSESFLADNSKREGVVTLESGLQYEVMEAGSGPSPLPTDTVSVNYRGTFIDGKEFQSNEGVEFIVNQLIPGWVEALPLMKVGSKWKLFIPADLAYGSGGSRDIPPNSALIFEMDLLEIIKEEVAEEAAK